ncbi:hypothetical protein DPMN_162578 [Dreissena polymorpha]|uniref:Uncharacterized protein n=1 Tax=Dreissena polymorpha TaxID=45954 RepID=A0A9D4EQP9_DREPO|nr:hypothetical protein DPMN_162578 [Dreissena polymorpha]
MDYDKLNIIRLIPMSHLATAVRSHPFVAVSAVAVGLIAIFYGYASTTSAVFALLLALLIHHTDYMDRQVQQLKDQIKYEVNGYHENTPKSQTPKESNNIAPANPLANVEQRRSDSFSKQQYLAKDGTTPTSPIGKKSFQSEIVALRCPKEQFRKLKHCCETIDGILTICDQDLADASTFLDEKLIGTITAFLDCHTLTSLVEALKDAKLPSVGTLLVGDSDTIINISGFTLLSTQRDTIVKDADILLERCALALLKILHSALYESEQSFFRSKEDVLT